jgi:hypothetical protein
MDYSHKQVVHADTGGIAARYHDLECSHLDAYDAKGQSLFFRISEFPLDVHRTLLLLAGQGL